MNADNMDTRITGYREVIPEQLQQDKWKELTLNTGGTPSTLQDIKVQQHAGGYCYKKCTNRFIYWRTNHDILELVEQSLNVNLIGNQLRYRFTDTPILEGISVHETYNSVVILVATVSSVHRFTYTHPDKLHKQGSSDKFLSSIFRDASGNTARDPTSYHVINAIPSLPHTAATCLNSKGDAVFALALSTGSVLLVYLEPLSGVAVTAELRHESIMPRFLSGITEAFLGRTSEDNTVVSLILHSINKEMYLFTLSRNGQLRVWVCEKALCVMGTDISDRGHQDILGAQTHVIRKAVNCEGDLVLCVYFCFSENSQVVVVEPQLQSGIFHFGRRNCIFTSAAHDLVDIMLDDNLTVWCIWVTGNGETAISYSELDSGSWIWVKLETPPTLERNIDPMFDPRQAYMDAIFQPGLFSVTDVTKALSIYRRSSELESVGIDLRQRVTVAVEAEIQSEVSEYELSDEEYLEVADRCWSRLYSCCVQYLQTGMPALGLLSLPCGTIVVLKKAGMSLLRPMDTLETLMYNSKNCDSHGNILSILQVIQKIDPGEDVWCKLNLALHQNAPLQPLIKEIAADLIQETNRITILNELREFNIGTTVQDILQMMSQSYFNVTPVSEIVSENFYSSLGVSSIITTLHQLTSVRLIFCRGILLLLELHSSHSMDELVVPAEDLCRCMWTLQWLSRTLTYGSDRCLILKQFLLSTVGLTRDTILESAMGLAQYIWPTSSSAVLAEFLSECGQWLLLQELARHVPYTSWRLTLAQSFLMTGEPYKAIDLVVMKGATVSYYLQAIQKFERLNYPDVVLKLADIAITEADFDDPELATLHSLSFLHHLKLGHYEDAYNNLEANPVEERRDDCLRQLVVSLVNVHRLNTLLSFPYTGMLGKLESLLEKRARSLDASSAAVYFNILFALHCKNDNYRKASTVMYEQATGAEDPVIQQQCYAVCLNTLLLVEPQNAWIVKSVIGSDEEEDIELLEVRDIQREFFLASAKCKLQNCAVDTTPGEVIAQCVAANFYKLALRLCQLCGHSYRQPFEALATACVYIAENSKAWEWLVENDISDIVTDASASTAAWQLLEHLMMKYEQNNQTILHKIVAGKIMTLSAYLPQWLITSYKRRNAAELLRLYLNHGDLQQASQLACEFLNAALGQGKEHFGIQFPVISPAPPLCLPVNVIDRLLIELKQHKIESDLAATMDHYIEVAMRTSHDKISAASLTQNKITTASL